ncbi:MAG: hypothetical protein K8U03_21140 [Planctomycetia bacterium]|nr:hypothetical protein [Planctomycetia bacterium]
MAVLAGGVWYAYHRVKSIVGDAYAVWWVADLVIHHLDANDLVWPKDWSDLQDDFEELTTKEGRPWTFEELRARVEVDWTADSGNLKTLAERSPRKPLRVIWLRDGTDVFYEGKEPNEMIAEYLRSGISERRN